MRIQWRLLQRLSLLCLVVYLATIIPVAKDFVIYSTAPIIQLTRQAGESVINSFDLIGHIATLAKENGQLQNRVNELTALEITNGELQHENDLLRKELSLSNNAAGLIAAQVISRSASVNQEFITINKGTNDGFNNGMAVLAQGYLVGRVDEALAHTSRIMLLTNADSLVPVVLQNSRSVGLLKGGADGLLVDEIPRDIKVAVNEAVVSANIGDVVKSGIPIGIVATVSSGKSDVFQSAQITSPIDTSRLEVVFGVK